MRIHYNQRAGSPGRLFGLAALALTILVLTTATSMSQVVFDKGNETGSPPDQLGEWVLKPVTPYLKGLGSTRPTAPNMNLNLDFTGTIVHSSNVSSFSGHDYTGSVYEFSGNTGSIMFYPKGQKAFAFYIASPTGEPIEVQVEGRGASESVLSEVTKIEGNNNALFFGFYAESNDVLYSVKVTVQENATVQIGEFLINESQ